MIREVPNFLKNGSDPQIHLDFENVKSLEDLEKQQAIINSGLLYIPEVVESVKKNTKTGQWEKNGIPLDDLKRLYEGNDNEELYKHK